MKTQADNIIERFGGVSALAKALGHKHPSTVQGWKKRGWIPGRQQQNVLNKALEVKIEISEADFFVRKEYD